MQSDVREPGVNPGRLRHCEGYKFPVPLVKGPGRRERGLKPKSGYRSGCARLAPGNRGLFSVKRRMRPARWTVFSGIRWMPSFAVLPGSGGFFIFRLCAGLPCQLRLAPTREANGKISMKHVRLFV